jgi:hypothetical protein
MKNEMGKWLESVTSNSRVTGSSPFLEKEKNIEL